MKSKIENQELRNVLVVEQPTEMLGFRLTKTDKQSIRSAAKSVGSTMTSYILNLHRYALELDKNA